MILPPRPQLTPPFRKCGELAQTDDPVVPASNRLWDGQYLLFRDSYGDADSSDGVVQVRLQRAGLAQQTQTFQERESHPKYSRGGGQTIWIPRSQTQ